MIILAYLGPFALIPLLIEKTDSEVQWHAKHGLVLTVTWLSFFVILAILTSIPVLGWIFGCISVPVSIAASVGVLVLHIICMVKGIGGERFKLPVLSDYADRF